VLVGQEPVRLALPIAWNDPTGRYDIRLIDLYTDTAVAAPLLVR